jgi:hypothetical protein
VLPAYAGESLATVGIKRPRQDSDDAADSTQIDNKEDGSLNTTSIPAPKARITAFVAGPTLAPVLALVSPTPPAALRAHKGDRHMYAKPNRYSGSLAKAAAVAAEAAERQAAADARRAQLQSRQTHRAEESRRHAERTSRGQPVMKHRLVGLLARIEKQQR